MRLRDFLPHYDPTPAELSGCFASVAQARKSVRLLESVIKAWRDSSPYELRGEAHEEFTRYSTIINIATLPQLTGWSLIAANALRLLRVGIDDLVPAIAAYQAGGSTPPRDGRFPFPICDTPTAFIEATTGWHRALSDDVLKKLEEVQPYNDKGGGQRVPPLAVLRDLSDKGQRVELAFRSLGVFHFAKAHPSGLGLELLVDHGKITRDTEIAVVRCSRPAPNLDAVFVPNLRITLGNIQTGDEHSAPEASSVLRGLVRTVASVIRSVGAKA